MTAFDAPRHSPSTSRSAFRGAFSALRAEPWAVLAAAVATAICITASVLFVLTIRLVAQQTASAAARTSILVVMNPTASRAETDAVGVSIKARADVYGAVLQSGEFAGALLARQVGSAAPEGPVRLPDVWIVTLRPSTTGDAALVKAFDTTVAYLASLEGVETVRVDESWVALLQTALEQVTRLGTLGKPGSVTLAAFMALLIAGLLARASGSRTPDGGQERALALPTALYCLLFVLLTGLLVAATYFLLGAFIPEWWTQEILGAARSDLGWVTATCLSAMVATFVGTYAAASGR